jgi:ABC-type xylose transport system permease subunit
MCWRSWPPGPLLLSPKRRPWRGGYGWHSGRARVADVIGPWFAGRGTVDLAVGPLFAFVNVSIVSLNGLGLVTSPLGVFTVAIGIGVIYQILFALMIIVVRVQPIIVALSGFLALSGINRVILPRPGGVAPDWMISWSLEGDLHHLRDAGLAAVGHAGRVK